MKALAAALAVLALAACAARDKTLAVPAGLAGLAACQAYDAMRSTLDDRYGERSAGLGVNADGSVTELFASPDSWTLVLVTRGGVACAIGAGFEWRARAPGAEFEDLGT